MSECQALKLRFMNKAASYLLTVGVFGSTYIVDLSVSLEGLILRLLRKKM